MKIFIHITFLLSFNCVFGQTETMNFTDSLGKKQGHWIFYGADRPESGILPEGKVEEGNYIDDRKEGLWIKYHDDGKTPKLKGNYVNNRPYGRYEKFYITGIIKESSCFSKNTYCDTLRRYYDNGVLGYEAFKTEYSQEQGRVNYFYRSGVLECTYVMVKNEQTELQCFDESGNLKDCGPDVRTSFNDYPTKRIPVTGCGGPAIYPNPRIVLSDSSIVDNEKPETLSNPNLKAGKWTPNCYAKVYNTDDEIWQDGVFKEGKLWDGKMYVYDHDGILTKVKIYKNGVYHSDGQL